MGRMRRRTRSSQSRASDHETEAAHARSRGVDDKKRIQCTNNIYNSALTLSRIVCAMSSTSAGNLALKDHEKSATSHATTKASHQVSPSTSACNARHSCTHVRLLNNTPWTPAETRPEPLTMFMLSALIQICGAKPTANVSLTTRVVLSSFATTVQSPYLGNAKRVGNGAAHKRCCRQCIVSGRLGSLQGLGCDGACSFNGANLSLPCQHPVVWLRSLCVTHPHMFAARLPTAHTHTRTLDLRLSQLLQRLPQLALHLPSPCSLP